MVALWRLDGGFVRASTTAIRPVRLAVFADGRAIADATRVIRLSSTEMTELLTALTQDLGNQPPTATPSSGSPAVADAPDAVLGVIKDSALKTVRVPAMDVLAPSHSYDARLVDARDRMAKVAERAVAGGTDYTADRIRVVAEQATSEAGKPRPWPSGVPVPTVTSGVGAEVLSGDSARNAARVLPRDTAQPGNRQAFKGPSGTPIAVSWRYLLPGESS
jgi:hypothetical protein